MSEADSETRPKIAIYKGFSPGAVAAIARATLKNFHAEIEAEKAHAVVLTLIGQRFRGVPCRINLHGYVGWLKVAELFGCYQRVCLFSTVPQNAGSGLHAAMHKRSSFSVFFGGYGLPCSTRRRQRPSPDPAVKPPTPMTAPMAVACCAAWATAHRRGWATPAPSPLKPPASTSTAAPQPPPR